MQGAEVQDGPPMLRCPGNRLDRHGPTSGAYGARRTAWRCAQACHRPGDEAGLHGCGAGLDCVSNNAIAGPYTNWRGMQGVETSTASSAEPPPCGISQLAAIPAPLEDAMMVIALARQESERVTRSRV